MIWKTQSKIVFYFLYKKTMWAKTYTKVSETVFKWSEERHLEWEIDAIQYLAHLADQINSMRKLIASANAAQERFLQVVEYYNESVDVLKEAKEKLHLAVTVPAKVDLPDCFSIIEAHPENLPKIDIKRDDEDAKAWEQAEEKSE